ncbi:putative secreted protein with PEP-CTERM sorting signal [Nitrosospira multiformis]|uniref:Putative secreted protein with PEP-CTERM sorting signal n=1 Tax=Nitrosospira multiformis TaxID=1231 RepID=A0A2T5IA91_9PROT|nr:PEP-CTERM sorting domain-containing protein [Nitrosospira multiformis]PTQ80731.1 putative secreted protein with PEP-CTERM sorting signal [Nitrosospira multiformis]
MIINHCFNFRSFIFFTVIISGFGHITHVSAQKAPPILTGQRAFLVDLNSRTVTHLDSFGPYPSIGNIIPEDISRAGEVVGSYFNSSGNRRAFITSPDGANMRDLGTLGGDYALAYGINGAGQVVGWAWKEGSGYAFITGPDGMDMTDLRTLAKDPFGSAVGIFSSAYGINSAGQVVGVFPTPENKFHAFITGPNGEGMRDLGTLGGADDRSAAYAINDAGQVVGRSGMDEYTIHAFITDLGGMGIRYLGSLGGGRSEGRDINDAGQVVGWSNTENGEDHAFITGPDGVGMRDLGTLGGRSSYADSINDAGQVVGYSDIVGGGSHAFITGPDGMGMMDLNFVVDLPEGWTLTSAMGINNHGQVIAAGLIPEPETYALMLAGLGLIGFVAWRQKSGSRD